MKKNVRDTSIVVYHELKVNGIINEQQEVILGYLIKNPDMTDREIERDTGIKLSAVNGRRNLLVQFGLVIDNGKRICSESKKTVYQWRPVDKFGVEELILKKEELKNKHVCPMCKGKGHIKPGQQKIG